VGVGHVDAGKEPPKDRSSADGEAEVQVVIAMVLPALVVASMVGLAASRWPRPVEAPRLPVREVVRVGDRRGPLGEMVRRRIDPSKLTGLALTVGLAVLALGLLGVGLLLRMVRTDTGFARWDLAFAQFGADHASPWTTDLLRQVTRLAGYEALIVFGLAVAAFEVRRTRKVAVVAFLVVVIGGQFALAETIKAIVDRTRPDLLNLTRFSGSSFPSGHATAAAAVFMAFALVLGRGRPPAVRAWLVSVAAGFAAMVAATRVLLGVHWFTDVLAGLLLGWAWFALCSIAFGGTILRFGTPAAQAEAIAEARGVTT
jgi:membrane-associated phospholipid phosphatase